MVRTRRKAFGLAAGEPVCGHRVSAEPGSDVGAGERGKLSDGTNPHPPQQIRQFVTPGSGQARLGGELTDRKGRQKPCIVSRFHHTPGPRGEDRGGQPIGNPDLALGAGGGHRVDQPLGRLLLRTEESRRSSHRQHQEPGTQHLGAGHQIVYRRDHPFEEASITVGVGGRDVQLRATGRRLPAPQPAPHSNRTCCRRAGNHPVCQSNRDRRRHGLIRGGRGRDGGPVHAPDRQHSGRGP